GRPPHRAGARPPPDQERARPRRLAGAFAARRQRLREQAPQDRRLLARRLTERESSVTSIAPWLSVKNATEALAYYRAAFGAIELERLEDESGDVVVAQLSIEGAD